ISLALAWQSLRAFYTAWHRPLPSTWQREEYGGRKVQQTVSEPLSEVRREAPKRRPLLPDHLPHAGQDHSSRANAKYLLRWMQENSTNTERSLRPQIESAQQFTVLVNPGVFSSQELLPVENRI